METSLKTGFAQIFSRCPKNLSCPKFGGAAAPLAPPARTPMHQRSDYQFLHTNLTGRRCELSQQRTKDDLEEILNRLDLVCYWIGANFLGLKYCSRGNLLEACQHVLPCQGFAFFGFQPFCGPTAESLFRMPEDPFDGIQTIESETYKIPLKCNLA